MEGLAAVLVQLSGPLLLLLIVYFIAILPRRRRLRQHSRMIEGLRPNDQVVTSAGIRGRVVGRSRDLFLIEVAPDVQFEVESSKIESVIARGQSSAPSRQTPQRDTAKAPHPASQGRPSGPVQPSKRPGNTGTGHSAAARRCTCGSEIGLQDRFCGECGREIRQ